MSQMSQMSEDWQVTSVTKKITICTTSFAKVKIVPFEKYSRIRAIDLVEKYIYELKLLKQYMIKKWLKGVSIPIRKA